MLSRVCERRISSPAGQAWLYLQHEPEGKLLGQCVAQRFFLNLKTERVWQRPYANHAEARIDIAADIVGFYDCERLNSAPGNLPPTVFERNMAVKEPVAVSEIT